MLLLWSLSRVRKINGDIWRKQRYFNNHEMRWSCLTYKHRNLKSLNYSTYSHVLIAMLAIFRDNNRTRGIVICLLIIRLRYKVQGECGLWNNKATAISPMAWPRVFFLFADSNSYLCKGSGSWVDFPAMQRLAHVNNFAPFIFSFTLAINV